MRVGPCWRPRNDYVHEVLLYIHHTHGEDEDEDDEGWGGREEGGGVRTVGHALPSMNPGYWRRRRGGGCKAREAMDGGRIRMKM